MHKRTITVLGIVCVLALGMMFTPKAAVAQEQNPTYFTYVSEWAVPRAQWAAFEKQQEMSKPTMQKLIANRTIVDWGNTAVRVHQEDGITHAEWFTATSRANLLKALEVEWTAATNPAYVSATKHFDLLLRTFAHGGKTSAGATGYLFVAMWQAKRGDESAFEAFALKNMKPFLDSEIANGTLVMYNFDTEDILTGPPGGYNLAMFFPSGAAMDKFHADLAAHQQENPAVGQILRSLTVESASRSSLSRVTDYQHQ